MICANTAGFILLSFQTTEAELKSLSQQRRIGELEAQLKEAEGAITDLRAELKQKGDELENAKINKVQSLNAKFSHVPPSSGCESSDLKDIPTNPRVSGDQCSCAAKQTERPSASGANGFDPHKSNFASIIMRSEKPESYRNGCTQRIRAFEGNVVNGKLPPDDDEFPVESEFISGAPEKETRNDAITEKKTAKACSVRKRKNRFGNRKTMRRCGRGQLSKSGKLSSTSIEADSARASGGSQESLQPENAIDEFKIFNKGKRKRNIKSQKPCQPSPALSRCRTFSYFLNGGIESADNQPKSSENEAKALVRKDSDPTSVTTPISADVKTGNKSEDDTEKNAMVEDSMIDDAPAPSSGPKESNDKATERVNGSLCDAAENNPKLKYTFQRKRKREAMSGPDEIASPEKISDASELQKSGSVDESSRDSRRLAQVARQVGFPTQLFSFFRHST